MKNLSILFAAAALLAGCATTEIDWSHQVGEMTFDQAVNLLGAPDKTEKLDNGQLAAEWVSRYGNAAPAGSDDDFRYHPASDTLNQPAHPADENTLRLTFGTNHVLSAWSKN